jgi:heme exporter protein B
VSAWRRALALARRDLQAESRRREQITAALTFAGLLLVLYSFALDANPAVLRVAAGGLLWLGIVFAGMLALGRVFDPESRHDLLDWMLSGPGGRDAIYLGKLLVVLAQLGLVIAVLVPAFTILFGLDLRGAASVVLVLAALGAVGFAALGVLGAGLVAALRGREAVLPLIVLPLAVPILIAGTRGTASALGHAPAGELWAWLGVLVVFDIVFLVTGVLAFEALVEE